MNGMVTWLIMECPPPVLRAAPLLGYAHSNYLYFINKVRAVTGVVIRFTTSGLPFYLPVTSAATPSYNCLVTSTTLKSAPPLTRLTVMELIIPLSENEVTQKRYHLFYVVIQDNVSLTYSHEKT